MGFFPLEQVVVGVLLVRGALVHGSALIGEGIPARGVLSAEVRNDTSSALRFPIKPIESHEPFLKGTRF
eukprot:11255427-Heterocapsa_arctica.AAC.1